MAIIETDISRFGSKKYSQNDEDGILDYLINALNLQMKYFVEFGVGPPYMGSLKVDGLEANCRRLRDDLGWRGLFMDGGVYPEELDVRTEYVTMLNINTLIRKHNVPNNYSVISIDVDGQDFWIWAGLETSPPIVIIEYNANLPLEKSVVVPFNVNYRWDSTKYFGASFMALTKLGIGKGYIPIYSNGVNIFFVKKDYIENWYDFAIVSVFKQLDLHAGDIESGQWLTV